MGIGVCPGVSVWGTIGVQVCVLGGDVSRLRYCRNTGVCPGGRDVSRPGYCRETGMFPA